MANNKKSIKIYIDDNSLIEKEIDVDFVGSVKVNLFMGGVTNINIEQSIKINK